MIVWRNIGIYPSALYSATSLPHARSAYRYFQPIATRWMDNDIYGHVNNVVYYAYFDTVINRTVRFPETTVAGEPITTWAPKSAGAAAYRQLAREVIAR